MNAPKLKICGITNLEDARFCAAAGADYLGFVQYAASPRAIDTAAAKEIITWIAGPEPVGVFVNETPGQVNRLAAAAGFRLVQLHGNESPEDCAAIDLPVIKAIRVAHDASAEQLRALMAPYQPFVSYFLLDTYHTNLWGGTGESFNWRLARELSGDFALFLAGGLNAGNIGEAVAMMRPYAVDLSSSLESSPGKKDFEKLGAFFEQFSEVA